MKRYDVVVIGGGAAGGSLLFAGEATENIYYGMVHSAIESGINAAECVIDTAAGRVQRA